MKTILLLVATSMIGMANLQAQSLKPIRLNAPILALAHAYAHVEK